MSNVDPLSIWAKLDPFRAMREIEASVGHAVFDAFSFDPARFEAQIEDELNIDLTPEQMLDLGGAAAAVIDEALEGGSAPDWVPNDAVIYIDLVGNRAWTATDGEVDVDTLLGSDPNTENWWGTTGYELSNLTADGYLRTNEHNVTPAFLGSARAMLLDGATIVARAKAVENDFTVSQSIIFTVMAADGNDALQVELSSSGDPQLNLYSNSDLNEGGTGRIVNFQDPLISDHVVNVLAVTVVANRFEAAANGSGAVLGEVGEDDRPSANPFVAAVINSSGSALQSITIYEPMSVEDTAACQLKALSQTGVTNTAPTYLGGLNAPEPNDVTTFVDNSTNGYFPALDTNQFDQLVNFFADAEGNPLTVTLRDNHERISAFDPGGGFVLLMFHTESLVPGNYDFTLRATDPDGLYVEQEFTITVTE